MMFPVFLHAQILAIEDFDYGTTDNADILIVGGASSKLTKHAGDQAPAYVATSLVHPNFVNIGIGGSIAIKRATAAANGNPGINDGDVSIAFENQTSGFVYAAFLVNISKAMTTSSGNGDYFFHFMNGTSGFVARILTKVDENGKLLFGLNKTTTGETTIYTAMPYAFNTTYLLLVKYSFNTASNEDDQVDLFINPDVNAAVEPKADLTFTGGVDNRIINRIGIRQGSNTATATLDHIIVAKNWADFKIKKKTSTK